MKKFIHIMSTVLVIMIFYSMSNNLVFGSEKSAESKAPAYLLVSFVQAQEGTQEVPFKANAFNPISPEIRAVLESTGVTDVQDWQHIGSLEQGFTVSTSRFHSQTINPYDLTMLSWRSDYLVPAILVAIFGMIILFTLFTLINGSAKVEGGMSGKTIKRWASVDIFIHWLCAIPCLFLIISGATLLTGKYLIEPNVGSAWASIIYYAKASHDIMVYPFILGWLLICIRWLKTNIPSRTDLEWFKVGGGYFNIGPLKHKHPDSGFVNAGEKIWYWTLAFAGVAVVVSGFMLMFPQALSVSRTASLIALLVHASSAIFIAAFAIVHMFMATILAPGTLSAMTTGYVDHNWAKQHHNRWFEEANQIQQAK
ncbi:formate dehydrogenase subunit gamma [Thalassotalea aquiviva]|uniref:formate dehydrogenase subunit gamma n=1 Tax=Thalassotalea aquiviva TaxID=3242415 RepID=UPI00352B14E7